LKGFLVDDAEHLVDAGSEAGEVAQIADGLVRALLEVQGKSYINVLRRQGIQLADEGVDAIKDYSAVPGCCVLQGSLNA